ncbi:oxidoreductase [Paenibacillus sp. LS1]|uniref:oxidoreductase n=1 Tax=Paenibacillus sp. LS1 TaxID=2992120 RepID=UPI00222E0FBB|nr:oxidoreductase [Paenibacillus sp. LS1]MCW3792881.1 oxidoreductase [Paenibacillus sp. LS1]
MKISTLETKLASRYNEFDPEQDGNKNTKFADIIIDGTSLYQRLLIDYFLLKKPHESMYYRYPILVCPWCGDEECGYISVKIDREGDVVIWRDFLLNEKKLQVGPFYFDWENYKQAIEHTFGTAGIQ